MNINEKIRKIYGEIELSNCPFTEEEILELEKTRELLIYLPRKLSLKELCERFEIRSNVNFDNERMIRNVMVEEDQWFITSASNTPELLYGTAMKAQRLYEDEGLHGMDFRRYLAYVKTYQDQFGTFPDQKYWTFLLSGSYDRSGVSIVGFDSNGVLSHHGWMRDFKSKFAGSRYIVLPPRIEINKETRKLRRAYRRESLVEEDKY